MIPNHYSKPGFDEVHSLSPFSDLKSQPEPEERTFDSLGNVDLAKIIQANKVVFGGGIMISPRLIRGFQVPERFEDQLRTFNEFLELYV